MTTNGPAIAVIGSGYWGKNLIRNYHEMGVLKLICDKNETILKAFKDQYSGLEACVAANDIYGNPNIAGVVIATPAETHFTLAREALLADKHVYVEKPLVLDEKEAEALIQIAKARKRILMVGHLLQYHPIFLKLKELSLGGELGRINYIYSNRLNLGKIRREENILWSFAPHDISMILALADDEPESVYATGGYYLHKKIADVTTTHLEFKSGLQVHIFVSWLHPFKEQKLVVVGDRKMAVFNDTKAWEDKLWLYPHQIKWEHNIPIPVKAEPEKVNVAPQEPLRQECKHFLHCIQTGEQPITNGQEGLNVLRVLNASQRSLDMRGAPVQLSGSTVSGVDQISTIRSHDYFAHDSAVIDDGVSIGKGTRIWHFSHVLKGSTIGQNCNIGQNVVVGPDVSIGNACKIQNNVSVYKGVSMEDGVFCGPSMVFTNIYNPRAEIRKMDQVRPTFVKKGATLGANSTIVCGTTIGRYAFVGAGSVVNKNISDHALVVGNPAKQIGWVCTCGERLSDNLECLACECRYEKIPDGLKEKL
ncbi:MAG: Gfo/Idh/MocA family oxidoreductase [Desulfosarcina sp.]|nr:Gfo/Idh/MocA family oxidoreductase [Desulfosarcina sp.]MBC2764929.1 Gfo/Idh/MocA family oxidoreductase [Desulfosarcina sp.]